MIPQRVAGRDLVGCPRLRLFLLLIWPYVRTPTLAYVTEALASYADCWRGNARTYCGGLRVYEVEGDAIIQRVEWIFNLSVDGSGVGNQSKGCCFGSGLVAGEVKLQIPRLRSG
jgi:hypothetical protein